jgi:hypothetical protein
MRSGPVRSLISIFWCFALLVLVPYARAADGRAEWMRENWGVRVVLPAGNNDLVKNFDPRSLVRQLASLRTPKWVMVNATQGGYGGYLTTPNAELREEMDPSLAPERDLLGETIALLKDEGFRVLVYFAAEGPRGRDLDTAGKANANEAVSSNLSRTRTQMKSVGERWQALLAERRASNSDMVADLVLEPIAERFGTQIDGWWFDHGRWGDARRYEAAVRKGNPDAVIAWNLAHQLLEAGPREGAGAAPSANKRQVWGLKRSNEFEDYTAGHITSTTRMAPWDDANVLIIEQVEKRAQGGAADIDGVVPHVMIPLQRDWGKGEAGFPTDKVIDWTGRMLKAGGSITWSPLLEQPVFRKSVLGARQYEQLKALDERIVADGRVRPRVNG